MEFPLYLKFKNRVYSVVGYLDDFSNSEYQDNKGYIKNGLVYICSKNDEPLHKDTPYFIVPEKGSIMISEPSDINPFKEDRLLNVSFNELVEKTNDDEELYDEEALRDMNAATSIFVPVINDDDDPLKKVIKTAIIEKKIDINALKSRMPKKYGLTNMKSALINETRMSIKNFNIWCELLGITYKVILSDNGSDGKPMGKTIEFSSDTCQITKS